RNYSRLKRKSF
ncbi:cag pathogenicity island protein, partial [Helicobacter pylori]